MTNTAEMIAALTARRESVEQRFKPLQAELEVIDAALADLHRLETFDVSETTNRVLTPMTGGLTLAKPPASFSGGGSEFPVNGPTWRMAHHVFTVVGRPMLIPEVAKEILRLGGPSFEERDSREQLRSTIRQKETVFEMLGEGWYALREWSPEQKRVRSAAPDAWKI
jgi:hypothetical protein